jgi:hypothetical protein
MLWAGNNRLLIALALTAALWCVRRRSLAAAVQVVWVAALFALANPSLALYALPPAGAALLAVGLARRRGLIALCGAALLAANPAVVGRLPYLALITAETVEISLFLPIGVLIGGGAAALWERLERRRANERRRMIDSDRRRLSAGRWALVRVACVAVVAGLALWGAWGQRDVVNPVTVLATRADIAAIDWAARHTPADARFLINAATWINTGRGADGGWWLLPLAGRWTSTPPAISDYGPIEYVRQSRARTRQVIDFRAGQEQAIYDLIDRDKITYVYLGANGRPLTPALFPASQGFEKVYEQDGVTIFAVHRP